MWVAEAVYKTIPMMDIHIAMWWSTYFAYKLKERQELQNKKKKKNKSNYL